MANDKNGASPASELESLKRKYDDMRDYTRRLINTEESLRKKLSSELHDEIGSDLSAINMHLSVLSDKIDSCSCEKVGFIKVRLNDVVELAGKTAVGIRGIMSCLRPPTLYRFGLEAALRWHADLFSNRGGIPVTVVAESFPRMDPELETTLFRISQEALMNVVKYAEATAVIITLQMEDDVVLFQVRDFGRGFIPTESLPEDDGRRGWGQRIMRERAAAVGGSCKVHSTLGVGTTVDVCLPLCA